MISFILLSENCFNILIIQLLTKYLKNFPTLEHIVTHNSKNVDIHRSLKYCNTQILKTPRKIYVKMYVNYCIIHICIYIYIYIYIYIPFLFKIYETMFQKSVIIKKAPVKKVTPFLCFYGRCFPLFRPSLITGDKTFYQTLSYQ